MGDQCLEAVADCIKTAYSKDGFCYRIGGDEFCVLLDANANKEECHRRLIEELDNSRKMMHILSKRSVLKHCFYF
ncbi:diguanylate cyclase [Faecalicatena contorta]|uniref:diguanylate cyclase domain-containing protein n=1 Tax=Faecalicatena contorta TaxID=39482 RepID=UPI001F47D909|nr:diguanylate cyclase [Faecalicatena contorta]MCF2679993.1 diguanylate cyclase [Faecalicatena contorta]